MRFSIGNNVIEFGWVRELDNVLGITKFVFMPVNHIKHYGVKLLADGFTNGVLIYTVQ